MENLQEKINKKSLRLSTNKTKLHQTDAKELKDLLHDLFSQKLSELDYIITPVENGFVIEVEHEEYGSIPVEAKFIIKPLDFDVESASEQHQEKIRNAAKRLAEKERLKAL